MNRQLQEALLDRILQSMSKEQVLDNLLQALSSDEAIENLVFIARMWDLEIDDLFE